MVYRLGKKFNNGKSVTIDKWFKDFMSSVCTGLMLED